MKKTQGTIISGQNNFFDVECFDEKENSNPILRHCSIKGKQFKTDKKYYNPLAPGDKVELEIDKIDDDKGQITSILPRKNAFLRYNIKGRAPQLLASNLDYLVLVTTPDEPPFRPRFIDRELAQAEYQEITPIIVCNKCDLEACDNEEFINRLEIWEKLGYKIIKVSAETGKNISGLASVLEGKLSAFVGQSGVGKSSIINALDPDAQQRTSEICEKYNRGSHTTTKGVLMHLELSDTAKADIIDTPGVRNFALNDIDAEQLPLYFREIAPFIGQCKFGISCTHSHEKGCAVIEAVENGEISEERYDSMMRIRDDIESGIISD